MSLDPLVAGHVKTSGCDPPDADKTKPLKVLLHESDLPSAIHDDITEPRSKANGVGSESERKHSVRLVLLFQA